MDDSRSLPASCQAEQKPVQNWWFIWIYKYIRARITFKTLFLFGPFLFPSSLTDSTIFFKVISERDLTQRFKLFHSFRFCFSLSFSCLFLFTPPPITFAVAYHDFDDDSNSFFSQVKWNVMFRKTRERLIEWKKRGI